jgi:hypothetical protein
MKRLLILLALCAAAAFGQAPHSVTLTWTEVGPATGFTFYRQLAVAGVCPTFTTSLTPLVVLTTEVFTYVDLASVTNPLTEGATYCYAGTAQNGGNTSVLSMTASATIPFSKPNAPVLGTPVTQ